MAASPGGLGLRSRYGSLQASEASVSLVSAMLRSRCGNKYMFFYKHGLLTECVLIMFVLVCVNLTSCLDVILANAILTSILKKT